MKNFFKTLLMGVILCAVVWGLGVVLIPRYWGWNADNKFKGVYKEKENTVQAVMFGTSAADNSFAATYLYDEYGITAYNLGSDQQPFMATLAWLKETKRLNEDSLKFVVLDMSYLFKTEEENQDIKRYLDKYIHYMKLTPSKLNMLLDLKDYYTDFEFMEYLFPALRYHSRWDQVDEDDLDLIMSDRNVYFSRGQNIVYDINEQNNDIHKCQVPNYTITDEMDSTEKEIEEFLSKYETSVFDEIVEYCENEGLRLVMVKLPRDWSDIQHDSITYLAEKYGLDFIDFNMVSVQEACGLNFPHDSVDFRHLNALGAQKVTDYIGRFLREKYSFDDMRENSDCDYIAEEAETYRHAMEDMKLVECDDLNEYLKALDSDRYTVFISVKGDAAKGLTDENRDNIAALGLEKLSKIEENIAYTGILSGGEVIAEKVGANAKASAALSGTYVNGKVTVDAKTKSGYDKNIQSADMFRLQSKGLKSGNDSRIIHEKKDYSLNYRGINFVVYDDETAIQVDRSSFETSNDCKRNRDNTGAFDHNEYNRLAAQAQLKSLTSMPEYISLASYKGMIAIVCKYPSPTYVGFTDEERSTLISLGIDGAAEAIPGTAYFLNYSQGVVKAENLVQAGEPLYLEAPDSLCPYSITYSAETNEYVTTIKGVTYTTPQGVQSVLVYDPATEQVTDFKHFGS